MTGFMGMFGKKKVEVEKKDLEVMDTLKGKYLIFQELLAENNRVLTLMSEMEEKLSGEQPVDREFVRATTTSIMNGVHCLIEHVNSLSANRYQQLYHTHAAISDELNDILADRTVIPVSDLVLPFADLDKEMASIAGHKSAHLSEIGKRLGLPTPEGFAISSYAFKKFMEHNRLTEQIAVLLPPVDIQNFEELAAISQQIQTLVREADIPEELECAIAQAVERLKSQIAEAQGTGPAASNPLFVSVRSSALHEDGEFTFAGQYATYLNVPVKAIVEKYKAVVASLFTPKALFYSKTKAFNESDLVMAVGVMRMLHASAGGVMYTRDPNEPTNDAFIINGLWGLGKGVVDGATPHSFVVSRDESKAIDSRVPVQKLMMVCMNDSDIEEVAVPVAKQDKACLSDASIRLLVGYGAAIERHYGCPQDIEWAADMDGQIYILQSRPLHIAFANQPRGRISQKLDNHPVLLDQGVIASKGIAHGRAFVLKDEEDLKNFPMGAVLVAHHTDTRFVTVMPMAAAIITDVGGITGHTASLAREYKVPAILDTGKATKVITPGSELTVDAFNGVVYSGRVEELLRPSAQSMAGGTDGLFRDSRAFKNLEKAYALIAPLYLVNPESLDFRQDSCRTLHDITRFIHEKAMTEIIFMSGRTQEVENFEDLMCAITFAEAGDARGLRRPASDLVKADIPMTTHVLDLDRELQDTKRKVSVKDISSAPFHAFLKGLYSMKWPQPIPTSPKNAFPLFPSSASAKGGESKPESKSYAIVANNYMNFNLKLGYHFSMVEAYASENINDNYIKYFFKGGGASPDRKLRRVRLIRELLKKIHFQVSVTDDVVNAMLRKYRQEDIERGLEIMGKLTVYTKQLDMAMFNDAVTDMFIEDFIRDHIPAEWF